MGVAISALGIEEIVAGIIGAGEAASEAGAAGAAAAAAGESTAAAIAGESGLSIEMTEAGTEAAEAAIAAGADTQGVIGAAADAIAQNIAQAELSEVGGLISDITGVPGGGIAGGGISAATGIETLGDIPAFFSNLITSGTVTEEVGIELAELGELTADDIAETGLTRAQFEAFEIESSESFDSLDIETRQQWNEIKELGKGIVDRVKQTFLRCANNIISVSGCIAGLVEAIKLFHDKFFKKGPGTNPNVIPSYRGADPFELGKSVGNLTAQGISVYYDELVKNPNLSKNEKAIDNLILNSFRGITNSLHNSLSRQIYQMIRISKFIKQDKVVQQEFDKIFNSFNGEFMSFPFRDEKTGKVALLDEKGKKHIYNGNVNLGSTTTFYGYWCGPLSYNDTYPVWVGRQPENGKIARPSGSGLLDSFCCAHDIDYTEGGYFNQEADFKLMSRIIHTQQHMTSKERSLALLTVAWFSTLGTILNTYLHPLTVNFQGRDPTKTGQQEDEKNDIFSVLYPPKAGEQTASLAGSGQLVRHGAERINAENNKQQQADRKTFYRGMKSALDNSFVDFIAVKGGGSANPRHQNSNLLQQFENLMTVQC